MDPVWIEAEETLVIHDLQLAEHGGAEGVRDRNLLESALARPRHLASYSEEAIPLTRLAAAYAFGLARNHPFVDGNKRTALVVCLTFLLVNGVEFDAPEEDTYLTFLGLAEGRVTEEQLGEWLASHALPGERR